jgi:hypothetical protein
VVQIHSPRPILVESSSYNFSNSTKSAMSAWYETKRSLLISARPKRSLPFEFTLLQGEFLFIEKPILRTVGTRLALGKKKQSQALRFARTSFRAESCRLGIASLRRAGEIPT